MKFLIVSLALLAVVAADVSHLSPVVKILAQSSDSSPEGSYNYNYETENGISVQESGEPVAVGSEGPAVVARGSYRYVADDGATYEVRYTADETGFHPEGAHLPVVPEAIQRSLEYNAAHPETESRSHKEVHIQAKPFRSF